MIRISTALAAFALAAAAAPAHAGDTPPEIVKGSAVPAYRAMFAAHPELRGQAAEAAVRCRVSAAGALSACTLQRAWPPNTPLGPALVAAAPNVPARPATHDGQPVASEILIELDRLPADKPADWARKPTPADLLAVWPKQALSRGVSGEATVGCLVNPQGALFDCLVRAEHPAGESFGAAALALTPQFLMKPATRAGQPVVSEVVIPINFKTFGAAQVSANARKTADASMIWAQAPGLAEVAAAYPPRARDRKLGGRAVLYCSFTVEGALRDCTTLAEDPRGDGFAAAARQLAHDFRAFPETADGKGLRSASVQLPVSFDPKMLEPSGQLIGAPKWAALPSAAEVTAAFANVPKGVGTIHVALTCTVQQGGWMGGCAVASESPPGEGLGPAALALAVKVRVITWTDEGLPVVGGRVTIPIRYESGAPEAAPAKPPPAP
jgi:TonB family protein